MDRKEELKEQIAALREELYAIEEKETSKNNALYLGKCYKYRNEYDSNSQWWLYAMIKDVNEDGILFAFRFQTDANGDITIEPRSAFYNNSLWLEISQSEFDAEWQKLLKELNKIEATNG